MRLLSAFVFASALATAAGAQDAKPSEVDTLRAENLALRKQLIEQHRSIGELQKSLGACNVELAVAALSLLDKGK